MCRRAYYQYKPKDRHRVLEAEPGPSSKEVLLFHYENPTKIFVQNAMAVGIFASWSFMAYTARDLKPMIDQAKERPVNTTSHRIMMWIADAALTKVAVGFFIIGEHKQTSVSG